MLTGLLSLDAECNAPQIFWLFECDILFMTTKEQDISIIAAEKPDGNYTYSSKDFMKVKIRQKFMKSKWKMWFLYPLSEWEDH